MINILNPLKCKVHQIDPIACWPFVMGVRERTAGHPKDPKRWITAQQQKYWEAGWDLMDELLFYKEGPTSEEEETCARAADLPTVREFVEAARIAKHDSLQLCATGEEK